MLLNLCGHDFHYECENLCRVFYPNDAVQLVYDVVDPAVLTSRMEKADGGYCLSAAWDGAREDVFVPQDAPDLSEAQELAASLAIYRLLWRRTGYTPPWGMLTGVRPSKLMITLIHEMGEDGARRYFEETLLVQPDKTALAMAVARQEDRILRASRPDSFSLYLSVPFCPSRCSYCSFVSHSIGSASAKKLVEPYVALLLREIEQTGAIARNLGLRLETVYIGGGTPTTLSASQLSAVCGALAANFPMDTAREFTVEAGRPDTVTREKLETLLRAGVTRISINPQTLNDDVLVHIGRRHTAKEAVDCFRLAREIGFDNINMDLIAGLETDTPPSFRRTLDGISALSPENITVHTLALKRSSRMVTEENAQAEGGAAVAEMLSDAQKMLTLGGYTPYYMYRQSRCVGNFENVGWCRPGTEGLYNVYMMEEVHTVLACGAGAVTKLREPHGKQIERVFNFKYPYEYISRFDELAERKTRIKTFYEEYTY
ncbi:MAG: coproporphyrinogen dehydrogenase HemZ [Clostridia bacterium]|nr:coproporphyrinogen dehydrogenase HemZ [Clostridia bacterium]